jgi:hypothetical protein
MNTTCGRGFRRGTHSGCCRRQRPTHASPWVATRRNPFLNRLRCPSQAFYKAGVWSRLSVAARPFLWRRVPWWRASCCMMSLVTALSDGSGNAIGSVGMHWYKCGTDCSQYRCFAFHRFCGPYPPKEAFQTARGVVKEYCYAVLFLFGLTHGDAIESNGGIQSLLFHPASGTTSRVHFQCTPLGVRVEIGELGDMTG